MWRWRRGEEKLNVTTREGLTWVAGAKREGGGGREKPSLPNPPLLSLPPYPLPFLTPATQARGGVESGTLSFLACVVDVERGRGRANLGAREGERKETPLLLLPPPSRVISRPNSLPLPFRTPATQAISFSFSLFSHALLTWCSLGTADVFPVVGSLPLGGRN